MSVNNDDSRGYERDSMERFGDDLTEHVLSFLWLKNKVKFQYVSKQVRRLVFNIKKLIFISLSMTMRRIN